MGMNEQCKHFQSRTYDSGEAARYCALGLAPQAPWACPDPCAQFAPRLVDVGWSHGSLIPKPVEPRPDVPIDEMTALLGDAEAIVAAASAVISDEQAELPSGVRKFWRRLRCQG